jgi:hypothetical protein
MWPGSFYLEIEPMLSQFLMKKKHDWSTNSPSLQVSGESCGKEELRTPLPTNLRSSGCGSSLSCTSDDVDDDGNQ